MDQIRQQSRSQVQHPAESLLLQALHMDLPDPQLLIDTDPKTISLLELLSHNLVSNLWQMDNSSGSRYMDRLKVEKQVRLIVRCML